MLIYINKISDLSKLLILPSEVMWLLLKTVVFIFCVLIILVISGSLVISKIEDKSDEIMGNFLSLYFKGLVKFLSIIISLILGFTAMWFIFSITIDTIIGLYNCHIDRSLFAMLIGPIITVLTISFSVFGFIWNKSQLQDFFESVNNQLPIFFGKISIKIKSHKIISVVLLIVLVLIFVPIYKWIFK